jgi:DNA-damage-inducible protein J
MALKSQFVRARIEPELRTKAESVLSALGLNTTDAITMFYAQIVLRQGLPFAVELPRQPNETTLKTFELTDNGQDLTVCKDVNDMFEKLRN